MDTLWQDVRFAVRTLTKAPGFTLVAVASLALGIGANTTIFTLINAIFLNALPVHRSTELVAVYTVDQTQTNVQFGNFLQVSRPNYLDFHDKGEGFTDLAAYSFPVPLSLATEGEPQQVFAEVVTGNYFDLLGVPAVRGRTFAADEDLAPGAKPVVVIGYGLWQRRLGGRPEVVGSTVRLNGQRFTIIGIAPEGFKGVNALFGPDAWVPSMMFAQVMPAPFRDWFDSRRALLFNVFGRMKPGVTMAQAESQLKNVAAALEKAYPEPNRGRTVSLRPLTEATIFPGLRQPLVIGGAMLMTIVGIVLLIACSNVANLLLARASTRRQEVAVRLALGAGRGRLMRQLLTESLLLGLAGGAVGLVVGLLGRDFIWSLRPAFLAQNFVELPVDVRVLIFTLVVSLATGVLFGLVPSLQASRSDVVGAIKEETRTAGRSRRGIALGNALVVGQVALSLVALVAAGLFLRSLGAAYRIDPGFETEKLAVLIVNPGQAGYDRARGEEFYRQVKERVERIPGVRSASWAANAPLFGGMSRTVILEGQDTNQSAGQLVFSNAVAPNYFASTGITLLRGRDFVDADREGSVRVAIVNETMAQRLWPNEDPIGRRFRFFTDTTFHEIVGIVRTSKYTTLGEDPQPAVYVPTAQNYSDVLTLCLATAGDPVQPLGTAQREIRAIDGQMPINGTFTIRQMIDQSLWVAQMAALLLGVLGALALSLAAVGLYGIMAYSVNQRQHEIGLRMALGADLRTVLRLVLRQGLTLVALGLGIGLVASVAISRSVAGLLYGVSTTDPMAFGAVSAILLAVSVAASLVPALRATRVDPVVALR